MKKIPEVIEVDLPVGRGYALYIDRVVAGPESFISRLDTLEILDNKGIISFKRCRVDNKFFSKDGTIPSKFPKSKVRTWYYGDVDVEGTS